MNSTSNCTPLLVHTTPYHRFLPPLPFWVFLSPFSRKGTIFNSRRKEYFFGGRYNEKKNRGQCKGIAHFQALTDKCWSSLRKGFGFKAGAGGGAKAHVLSAQRTPFASALQNPAPPSAPTAGPSEAHSWWNHLPFSTLGSLPQESIFVGVGKRTGKSKFHSCNRTLSLGHIWGTCV